MKVKRLVLLILFTLTVVCATVSFSACAGNGEIVLNHNVGEWETQRGVYLGMVSDEECPTGNINESLVKNDIEMQIGEEYYFIVDFTLQPLEDNDGRGSVDVSIGVTPAAAIAVTLQETSSGSFTESTLNDTKQITVPFSIPEKAEQARDKRIVLKIKPIIASEYIFEISFNSDKPLAGDLTNGSLTKITAAQFTQGLEYTCIYDGVCSVSAGEAAEESEITIPYFVRCNFDYIISYYNVSGYYVRSIADEAFKNCNIKKVIIPDSITSIGEYAFYDCSELSEAIIPDSVITIGNFAFNGCSGLKSLIIPDSLTSISDCSFSGCASLTNVTIGKNVTDIGTGAFLYCRGLTSITIPDSVTGIGQEAFYGCSGLISVTIGNGVRSIVKDAFRNCYKLTTVTLGASVQYIGDFAFYECYKLIEVYNKSKLRIEPNSSDNGYISFFAPNVYTQAGGSKLTEINDFIIYNDNALINYIVISSEITVPENVTVIAERAFENCSELTSVTIPKSLTNIEMYAFSNCVGLTDIYFEGTTAQWNVIWKGDKWNYGTGDYTIHCTDGDIAKAV